MAELTFLGAAGEVTGSRYRIDFHDDDRSRTLLLECGMHQGGPEADAANARESQPPPSQIDAVVISHGHLDHAGLLPRLVREGYAGPIHCTGDTLELLEIMLVDAAVVMERDMERENRWRRRAHKPLRTPLYEQEDVARTLELCVAHDYDRCTRLPGGVELVFRDAGHILGSAIVELTVPSGGRRRRLVFSGDLGNADSVLMREPARIRDADVVLMESTYGDRDHRPMADTLEEFSRVLEEANEAGGNVLIPAFAVGRTQEILYHLGRLHHEGRLRQQRIFLDSPMAIRVTELYARSWRALDRDDVQALHCAAGGDPARYLPGLRATRTVEESMAINRIRGGAIIIAGAGMCTGGRILHHFRYNLARSSCRVIIVGFQATGTPGRMLVDGAENLRILGEEIPVRARVHTIGGFSAHAGRTHLVLWAGAFRDKPRFWLVHGEPGAQQALSVAMKDAGMDASVAVHGDVIPL